MQHTITYYNVTHNSYRAASSAVADTELGACLENRVLSLETRDRFWFGKRQPHKCSHVIGGGPSKRESHHAPPQGGSSLIFAPPPTSRACDVA